MAAIDRLVGRIALAMALLAGAVLVAVTLLTVASIAGRNLDFLGLGPVPGDVELVQLLSAFAVTACLSWCQWRRGHVTVDIVLGRAGPRLNAVVDLVANILMTAAAAIIAWRLALGMLDKIGSGFMQETTFILSIPIWWGYAAVLAGAAVFVLTCAWTVVRSVRELGAGRSGPGEMTSA